MPIKNQQLWESWQEKNKDPYGGAVIKVATRAMEILDEDSTQLHNGYYPDPHTAHGIICIADEESKAGGITGFMASFVAQIVFECHSRGDEFRKSHNGDYQGDGVVNTAVLTIS